jgi:hypothetical protein
MQNSTQDSDKQEETRKVHEKSGLIEELQPPMIMPQAGSPKKDAEVDDIETWQTRMVKILLGRLLQPEPFGNYRSECSPPSYYARRPI